MQAIEFPNQFVLIMNKYSDLTAKCPALSVTNKNSLRQGVYTGYKMSQAISLCTLSLVSLQFSVCQVPLFVSGTVITFQGQMKPSLMTPVLHSNL